MADEAPKADKPETEAEQDKIKAAEQQARKDARRQERREERRAQRRAERRAEEARLPAGDTGTNKNS
jgi:hypothetical protein